MKTTVNARLIPITIIQPIVLEISIGIA